MRTLRTRALALASFGQGESNRVVDLLTEGHGLVRAVAHGVRKPGSKFGSALEPGTLSRVLLAGARGAGGAARPEGLFSLREAETERAFAGAKGDLPRLEALFELLGLCRRTAPLGAVEAGLFHGALGLLAELDAGALEPGLCTVLARLEALRALGRLPEWTRCGACGGLEAAWLGSGGPLCEPCRAAGGAAARRAPPAVLAALDRLSRGGAAAARALGPDAAARAELQALSGYLVAETFGEAGTRVGQRKEHTW